MEKLKVLPPKYQKALELVIEGSLSYKQIADKLGFSADYLYQLVEGKEANRTASGKLFYESLQEHDKARDKEIRDLIKNNKKLCQRLLNEYLGRVGKKKNNDSEIPLVTSITNALAKSTPNIEIGSFTFQKGLSPDDIYGEFKRLTGLTSDRGAIQGASARGTGEIPVAPRPRVATAQESEDPILPTEPEA
jgi:hypothetical protein